MYSGRRDARAFDYLRKVLAADPEWTEVRVQLAEQLLAANKSREALAELATIKRVDPSLASRFFRITAYASTANGLTAEARKNAASAAKYANEMWEKESVARLDEYLSRLEEARSRNAANTQIQAVAIQELLPSAPLERADLDTRPRLVRKSASGDERIIEVEAGQQVVEVEGDLVQVDCMEDSKARLYIQTSSKRIALAIHDPGSIIVRSPNNAEGLFDLTCGPQKKKIRADYIAGEDVKLGTIGALKIIEVVP